MAVNDVYAGLCRFVRGWLAGGDCWGSLRLEPRAPSALMQPGQNHPSSPLPVRAHMPYGSRGSVQALSQVLDRQARAGMACPSLAVVEHMLVVGTDDPLKGLSPWILRQASRQLEALSDIGAQSDLAALYWQMRRISDDACFRW